MTRLYSNISGWELSLKFLSQALNVLPYSTWTLTSYERTPRVPARVPAPVMNLDAFASAPGRVLCPESRGRRASRVPGPDLPHHLGLVVTSPPGPNRHSVPDHRVQCREHNSVRQPRRACSQTALRFRRIIRECDGVPVSVQHFCRYSDVGGHLRWWFDGVPIRRVRRIAVV